MEVGIRELRNQLSRYLARVRRGEEVVITDRGRAIARVLPIGEERPIDRLIAEGVITPAKSPQRSLPRTRVAATDAVSDLVTEQRR